MHIYVHLIDVINHRQSVQKKQGAKNNNNFDTTSEIMFLALTPLLGSQKSQKYEVNKL